MALTPGVRLGVFEILHPLGSGGMGDVYRARHLKLRRDVAIKVLPEDLASDHTRLARFEREARTASGLNHPNIVTIYDIGEHDGTTYIAMELVEGRTLRELIAEGPIGIDRLLLIAAQIADGLAKAHAAGVIHRDIKPANVMVTSDGLVKILDFGLAKPLALADGDERAGRSVTELTRDGVIVGTPQYMSPEQLAGDQSDHRADQFAFGVLLYELATGALPFDGPSIGAVISAVLADTPLPVRRARPDVPADLDRLISRCLEKDAANRWESTASLAADLRSCEERRASRQRGLSAALRRPIVAGALAVLLLLLGTAALVWSRGSGQRWADRDAMTEITSLVETGDLYEAFRTAREAEQYRPNDPDIARVLDRITLAVEINTRPAGAEVLVKGYATPDAEWERIGVTPLTTRMPYAMMRWRIMKAGFEPFEGAPFSSFAIGALRQGLLLDSAGARPAGMVRVPGGPIGVLPGVRPPGEQPMLAVGPFYLDRYEVTNRQFKEFVDAGGYEDRKWWPASIEREGKAITWATAVNAFRDATGRPGPSTWQLGHFRAGDDDHPVGGISWYEAAAYCAFAGKNLPTLYHWFRALGQEQLSDILLHSNMNGEATARVGQFKGLAAYGTYDMAGNVKEWVWNATGEARYILGGSWDDASYVFRHRVARDSWARQPTHGVRCARYIEPPSEQLMAPVSPLRKYDLPAPISDEAFELVRGVYAYDRDSLDHRVERVNDSLPGYRRETVSFATAYGNERMEVHLLIPRDVSPPYQSVIWFPGGDVYGLKSSDRFSSGYLVDFLPRAGRVLVHPVYDGMYERFRPPPMTANAIRDMSIRWSKDIGRTIDYLETRSDFDVTKIAYYGFSGGANHGPLFSAIEPRISASILLGGGLILMPLRPEMHPVNVNPRSRIPTLMINGIDDFILPYEYSQLPFFEMLGAPADRKKIARLEGGHIPTNRLEIVREVLDWLDLHLGQVQRTAAVASASP